MARFCVKCGAPLSGGPFCMKCGADARNTAPQTQTAPASSPPAQTAQPAAPGVPGAAKKMSPLAKLGIAAVIIIIVGGALAIGGVYYVAHRVSPKIHEEAGGLLGSSSSSDNSSSDNANSSTSDSSDDSLGDVCRFLSKEVSAKRLAWKSFVRKAKATDVPTSLKAIKPT